MNDLTKFCRIPGERRPRLHTQAVINGQTPRFTSDLGWRNYQAAMAEHDPADADHYAAMFVRFVRDTTKFRQERKAAAQRAIGGAHCYKVAWLKENIAFDGKECLLFPSMSKGFPTEVKYNFKKMAAARAMLLMTQGLPPSPKMFAVHKCGNGHLSCVNPAHIKWGTPSDNMRDRYAHVPVSKFVAGMSADLVESIRQSPDMVNVIAERHEVPAGVVAAIKRGEQFA